VNKELEPQPPHMIGPFCTVYKGRRYYDTWVSSGGSQRAEIAYLTDWKRWALKEMGRERSLRDM
jgi:hypothetical protein